ncbi:hypothetical protein FB451DRAFT_1564102 [Mycena latifolia]|nr:hypothetical protein FB451DRAFT_1564102 [Mycena latifolia]
MATILGDPLVSVKVGELMYKLFDVGGERKWIHCFEDVTALVFLVAKRARPDAAGLTRDGGAAASGAPSRCALGQMHAAVFAPPRRGLRFASLPSPPLSRLPDCAPRTACKRRLSLQLALIRDEHHPLFLNKIDLFAERLPRSSLSAATKQIYAHYALPRSFDPIPPIVDREGSRPLPGAESHAEHDPGYPPAAAPARVGCYTLHAPPASPFCSILVMRPSAPSRPRPRPHIRVRIRNLLDITILQPDHVHSTACPSTLVPRVSSSAPSIPTYIHLDLEFGLELGGWLFGLRLQLR